MKCTNPNANGDHSWSFNKDIKDNIEWHYDSFKVKETCEECGATRTAQYSLTRAEEDTESFEEQLHESMLEIDHIQKATEQFRTDQVKTQELDRLVMSILEEAKNLDKFLKENLE